MKRFFRVSSFILGSLVIIGAIFFGGYFVGIEKSPASPPNNLTNTVNATNEVDFSPFWKVWDLLDDKYIAASSTDEVTDQERVWGAIQGMVDSLDDPYTSFLPPKESEDFETAIQGEFSGVGMEVGIVEDIIAVIAPLKDTPADRAGLQAEDLILAIDGIPTVNMSIDDAVDLIRGEVGTAVVLTIGREGVDIFDVAIVRDIINIPTLDTEEIDDVFVIHLYNFSAKSADDFRDALREFIETGKNKLVLDLRGNPGGFLSASIDMASWFLPAGKVVVTEDFGDEQQVFRSKGYDIFNDNLEMLVLVNGGSASASEILAGALREHGVAEIVGSQTFGKGSVQELIEITPETSLKVTIAQWLIPDGTSISDGGITPDYVVDEAPEGESLSELQLNRAIELLK